MRLVDFLNAKPLYYDKIDLSRMPKAYGEVKDRLRLGEVVHLVGTNGKGSTGRMLASMLAEGGARVGHYTSPHVFRFNERVWIDGEDADDELLERAHRKLIGWLAPETAESLSYFEYTTLLALVAFEDLDYVVLEAGLGGEFDATNVVPKSLSVVTPIGLDHQAFLGDSIGAIAATKLRSVDRRAVIAPQPDARVYEVAERIGREKGAEMLRVETILGRETAEAIRRVGEEARWPEFFFQNARTAAAAYETMRGCRAPVERLKRFWMRGRFERVAPNVVLDVGHNPLGAEAVARALKGEKRILLYNALTDKDVEAVLGALEPVVESLEIVPIGGERAMPTEEIVAIAERLGIPCGPFEGIDPSKNYLVFGSFLVAESFLKRVRDRNAGV